MSNVQVGTLASLNASQSLSVRRGDTRTRASVCRSLFGPVDHEELNRDIKSKLREISERDQQRWNFDFDAGTPMAGDYEWEEAPGEASPAFYQESVQVGRRKRRGIAGLEKRCVELPNGENSREDEQVNCGARLLFPDQMKEEQRADCGSSPERSRRRGANEQRKRSAQLSTTRITDFYAKRRNTEALKRGESAFGKPLPSVSEEQTPRKRLR